MIFIFTFQNLRKKLTRGAWIIVNDRARIHQTAEKIKEFEESFETIKQETGMDNIEDLVNSFLDAEKNNFRLFNEVHNFKTKTCLLFSFC